MGTLDCLQRPRPSMAATKMSLKLLVDQRNQTVLFAEAGKDFVDFLFHCLALPVGTIVSLLPKTGVAGSLRNLYASVENLSDTYIERREKEALLNPKARTGPDVLRLLLPDSPPSAPVNYYTCAPNGGGYYGAPCSSYVTNSPSTKCPGCSHTMSKKLSWVAGPAVGATSTAKVPGGEGGYVRGIVTYMVMDDLIVKPMSTISCITLLNRFNVHEIGDLKEKVIDFGLDEAIKLLNTSLHSKTVLTDIFSGVLTDRFSEEKPRYYFIALDRLGSVIQWSDCSNIISAFLAKEDLVGTVLDLTQRMATGKVSLKLVIHKSNRTVLFAEAGKDFVDFLLHILVLPIGQVIQLLTKTGMVGSLGNLYDSVEKLNDVYIKSSKKDIFLKPKAPAFLSEIPFLLPETSSLHSPPKTYYRCSSRSNVNCWNYVAEDRSALCPQCKNSMNQTFTLVRSASASPAAAAASAAEWDGKGGFVLGEVMYMVMDDLAVKPMSTVSSITLLKNFNVEEIGLIEEKVVSLGMDEGIKLLMTSLHSKKVLTDVFLGSPRLSHDHIEADSEPSGEQTAKEDSCGDAEDMTQRMASGRVNLKLLVHKNYRKVLFAEGGKDFIDFLFHILALPVGTVIRLLEKTGMVGSLGNLYSSVQKLDDVYIESSKKDILLKPKAPACVSEIPLILPETSSDSTPTAYYRCPSRSRGSCLSYVAEDPSANCPHCNCSMNQAVTLVKSQAGNPTAAAEPAAVSNSKGGFVQGVVTYMVMDDLEVKPMSTISSITLFNEFNVKEIGLLEEKVVSLGIDEGIRLLKASFHSKKVLTDVFLGEK
ncbi:uncharacterized protein LOC115662783 [Syzygium oleosum]|uniref:uncharacterized protein LOC115662783 n=1 Tax=Syzygium oleosum TaxID=219896 RepID=UPI0024B924CE|nr:uncharacterized protein LOC115662783 [Syzygium oleosum]